MPDNLKDFVKDIVKSSMAELSKELRVILQPLAQHEQMAVLPRQSTPGSLASFSTKTQHAPFTGMTQDMTSLLSFGAQMPYQTMSAPTKTARKHPAIASAAPASFSPFDVGFTPDVLHTNSPR